MVKWLIWLILPMMIIACNAPVSPPMPTAQAGQLDLTSWDFERHGLVSLAGEWELYWQQLLTPTDFQAESPPPFMGVNVPTVWANYQIAGQPFPAYGYGTFRLKVKVKPTPHLYGLKVAGIGTAYRLWVNGQELLSDGTVGTTRQTTIPRNDRRLVLFSPPPTDTLELVIQVANFHNWTGGIWYPIYLGFGDEIIAQREYYLALDLFLCGGLLIIGLYHLGLYSLRRNDNQSFYFGIFCLIVALRSMVTGENYLSILQPGLSWTILLKIEYLTFYWGLPVFMAFLQSLYPDEFGAKAKIFHGIALIFGSVVLITPPYVFTYTLFYFQVTALITIFYACYALAQAIRHRRDGILIISSGQVIIFVAVINDILYANNLIATGYAISWGLIAFVIFQSLALSLRSAQTVIKLEALSHQLSQEITEREHAEASITTSEARYRQLVELSPDGIFIHQKGIIVYTNQALVKLLHAQQPTDLIGQSIFNFIHPTYHASVHERMRRSADEGLINPLAEEQFITLDGLVIDVEVAATSYTHQNEKATQVIVRDISQRKKVESELKKHHDLLEERVQERTTELTLALRETEALLRAAPAILGANQFQAICQNLVSHFTRLVTTHWIALFMVNHDQRRVIHREYYGDHVPAQWIIDVQNMTYEELELGLSGQVFQSKQPILSITPQDEPDMTSKKRQEGGYGALMVVPLVSKGVVSGTITAVNRHEGPMFTPHDVELLMTLATQAAVAIDNVRLLEAMQAAKETTEATNKTLKKLYDRLQGELIFARKIQQSLLPPPCPQWPDLELVCYNMPAREIGGDLYAYCHGSPPNSYYGFAVGDVSGKGMPAALLMAVSLTSFQSVMGQGLSPSHLLQALDEILVPYTKTQQQNCAMCYVEIKSSPENATYTLRVANAACIPPYIKRVTGEIENYELGGFALGQGLGHQLGYQEQTLGLNPGDLIILVSDGVIEAHNPRHEMLGFEGLLQRIEVAPATTAADMLAYLKQELLQFTEELEQHDDITIVVARINPEYQQKNRWSTVD